MRLIDADRMLQNILTAGIGKTIVEYSECDIANIIKRQPVIDAIPVRHGCNVTAMHPADEFVCSECGAIYQDFVKCEIDYDTDNITYHECEFKYCPNCGARMDL